jgi:hypothetical protein
MWQRTSFARFVGSTGTLGLLLLAVVKRAGCVHHCAALAVVSGEWK